MDGKMTGLVRGATASRALSVDQDGLCGCDPRPLARPLVRLERERPFWRRGFWSVRRNLAAADAGMRAVFFSNG